ncbi:MAG TPA: hypothetical protein VE170_05870 [Candidatus Limnocylindria bacterium]|nr:hypothetical protein [Candidatus Limnocylindria bacterium]
MHRAKLIFTALLIALLAVVAYLRIRNTNIEADLPRATLDAYLRATYARNFTVAYDYLSSADRQVRTRQNYVDSQGGYSGFTLDVARQLAGFMEIWSIDRHESGGRLIMKVGYRVPAPAELNELLLHWDEARLNSLSTKMQKDIVAKLTARNKSANLLNIEGQETVELIEEPEGWKVHLDWAAGTRVVLASRLSDSHRLDVRFASTEVIAKSDELFLVNVRIKNPTAHAVSFSVNHLLEPPAIADDLQLVDCGLLTPVTLAPQQEKEFAMAYLLDRPAGKSQRRVKLTYDFKIE